MAQRTCKACDQPLPDGSRRDKVYCSKRCCDDAQPACQEDGCDKPRRARGLCVSHYNLVHSGPNRYRTIEVACGYCDTPCIKRVDSSRKIRYCSDECRGLAYSASMSRLCKLPKDHPVRQTITALAEMEKRRRSAAKAAAKQARLLSWRTERECPGCAARFCPLYTSVQLTCSKRCAKRVGRRARRASEAGAYGTWIWSDFMRIAQRFGFCCAYCGEKPKGQLDPDHVVALSRGGANTAANLLPSCRACNCNKSAHTLDEWAEWRAMRGLPPRATSWAPEDRRYHHLSLPSVTKAA